VIRALGVATFVLAGCARCAATSAPPPRDAACEKYAFDNHLDAQRACYGDAAVQGGDAGVTGR
jgi:hypothetical protein